MNLEEICVAAALPEDWQGLDRNKQDLLRASVVSLAMAKYVRGAGGGNISGAKIGKRLEELQIAMGGSQ
ncbi:hypothetical protein [Pseudoxanthomonas winnipegensis]|uniref:hypothetical protein n=1 Tax=Pseudoxanthomonas winnipegensis TaxID=2480810 RepID=UPI0030F3897F